MIKLLNPDGTQVIADEGESNDLLLTLYDASDPPLPIDASAAESILLTLYDLDTETVINDRLDQPVKGANGGTVEPDGRLRIRLNRLDNILLNGDLPADDSETHVARIHFTYDDGTGTDPDDIRRGTDEFTYEVRRLRSPTTPP